MDTASVIITAFAVMCLLVSSVVYAVLLFRALQQVSRTLVTIMNQYADQQSQLLDRFQAIRWEDLMTLRSIQDSEDEEGGFFEPSDSPITFQSSNGQVLIEDDTPPEEDYVEVLEPGWGSLSEANRRARVLAEEQALLEEDFPEEMTDEDRRSN
jgi:hypothetical protein